MRGKKTDNLTLRAVRHLDGHLTPIEIMAVLGLPNRTARDLIHRVREKIAQEEAERQRVLAEELARQERERLERQQWEARVLSRLRNENDRFSPTGGVMVGERFLD